MPIDSGSSAGRFDQTTMANREENGRPEIRPLFQTILQANDTHKQAANPNFENSNF